MNNKYIIGGLVIVGLIAIVALFTPSNGVVSVLGGSTDYNSLNLHPTGESYALGINGTSVINTSGVWVGNINSPSSGSGELIVAATSTAQTLTGAQVCALGVYQWNAATTTGSLTLPSSADIQTTCLSTLGSSRSLLIENTSPTSTNAFGLSVTNSTTTLLVYNYASSTGIAYPVLPNKPILLRFTNVDTTSTDTSSTVIQAELFQ